MTGPPEDGDDLVMEYFDQRLEARVEPDEWTGTWQLARTRGDWRDDLKVTYRRARKGSDPFCCILDSVK